MMENKVRIDGIWYKLNNESKTASVTSSDNEEEKYQGEVVIPDLVVYEGEEYALQGIDTTPIVDGAIYKLVYTGA